MEPTSTLTDKSASKPKTTNPILGQIEAVDGEGRVSQTWRLSQPRCTIGSSVESVIRIDDGSMAPVHALIVFGRNHTLIRAMGGQVRIAGRVVREWLIDEPTMIQCGGTRCLIHPPGSLRNASQTNHRVSAGSLVDQTARLRDSSMGPNKAMETDVSTSEPRTDSLAAERVPSEPDGDLSRSTTLPKNATFVAKMDPNDIKTALEPLHHAIQVASDGILELTRLASETPSPVSESAPPAHTNLNEMTQAIESLESRVSTITSHCESLIANVSESIEGRMSRLDEFIARLAEVPTSPPSVPNHQPIADGSYRQYDAYSVESASKQTAPFASYADYPSPLAADDREPEFEFDAAESKDPSAGIWPEAEPAMVVDEQAYEPEVVSWNDRAHGSEGTLLAESVYEPELFSVDAHPLREDYSEPADDTDLNDATEYREHADRNELSDAEAYASLDEAYAPLDDGSDHNPSSPILQQAPSGVESGSSPSDLPSWFTQSEDVEFASSVPTDDAVESNWSAVQLNPIYAEDTHQWLSEADASAAFLPSEEAESYRRFSDPSLEFPIEEAGKSPTESEYRGVIPADLPVERESELFAEDTEPVPNRHSPDDLVESASSDCGHEGDEDTEESIEDYMARLLDRVRGGSGAEDQTVSNLPTTRTKPLTKSTSAVAESETTESIRMRSAPTSEMSVDQPVEAESRDFVPRQAAPERSADLAALRSLANDTARHAIQKSSRRKIELNIIGKVAISLFGLGGAVLLLVLNGFHANVAMIGTIASFVVFLLWGYEAVVQVQQLQHAKVSSASGTKDSANDPTGPDTDDVQRIAAN